MWQWAGLLGSWQVGEKEEGVGSCLYLQQGEWKACQVFGAMYRWCSVSSREQFFISQKIKNPNVLGCTLAAWFGPDFCISNSYFIYIQVVAFFNICVFSWKVMFQIPSNRIGYISNTWHLSPSFQWHSIFYLLPWEHKAGFRCKNLLTGYNQQLEHVHWGWDLNWCWEKNVTMYRKLERDLCWAHIAYILQ